MIITDILEAIKYARLRKRWRKDDHKVFISNTINIAMWKDGERYFTSVCDRRLSGRKLDLETRKSIYAQLLNREF